ncbi:MAG: pyridoxal-phosphate dependent enzyme [Bacteroidetes bacterium]|nr:pyridoxal-phosphate dependent enzyme [Bacteroidota bacterium]
MKEPIVSALQIRNAGERIKPYINRTPVMTSASLNKLFNTNVFFKCENFQKVGAFKARGATNAVRSLSPDSLMHGVATHSSGNHAQALSWAAALAGTKAYIVMPSNSSPVKIEAVKGYGGLITFCEPTLSSREETLQKVIEKTGAIEIHPYNDTRIIEGQATSALELFEEIPFLDLIIVPVGGGGLLSGTALSALHFSSDTKVIAAEPMMADDAFRSFKSGTFIPSVNPETIADGLRTSLGSLTFQVIREHVSDIVTVSEESIVNAMRFIWERMKIIVETSSAVPLAAIMEQRIKVDGKRTGIILSGGNVDLSNLPW